MLWTINKNKNHPSVTAPLFLYLQNKVFQTSTEGEHPQWTESRHFLQQNMYLHTTALVHSWRETAADNSFCLLNWGWSPDTEPDKIPQENDCVDSGNRFWRHWETAAYTSNKINREQAGKARAMRKKGPSRHHVSQVTLAPAILLPSLSPGCIFSGCSQRSPLLKVTPILSHFPSVYLYSPGPLHRIGHPSCLALENSTITLLPHRLGFSEEPWIQCVKWQWILDDLKGWKSSSRSPMPTITVSAPDWTLSPSHPATMGFH